MTGKLYIMDKKNENKSLKKKIHNKKIIKDIKIFFFRSLILIFLFFFS